MKKKLQALLYSVGIFPSYCGYNYLTQAVFRAIEEPRRLQSIRKEIYQPIADKEGVEIENLEKCIRTVRDIMIKNEGAYLLAQITGSEYWVSKRLHPKDLIAVLANYLTEEE